MHSALRLEVMRPAVIFRFVIVAVVLSTVFPAYICQLRADVRGDASTENTPNACPADLPVDDLMSELKKQEKTRNKQLKPESFCLLGWCRQAAPAPPTVPKSAHEAKPSNTGDYSTSKSAVNKCDLAMEQAIEAAHDVEVGDYNAKQKNYRGALMRYQDALDKKPNDAAINVRLGRMYEKLGDIPHAKESYNAALNCSGPTNWTHEAQSALTRLD